MQHQTNDLCGRGNQLIIKEVAFVKAAYKNYTLMTALHVPSNGHVCFVLFHREQAELPHS